jgi:hypothetical protein
MAAEKFVNRMYERTALRDKLIVDYSRFLKSGGDECTECIMINIIARDVLGVSFYFDPKNYTVYYTDHGCPTW